MADEKVVVEEKVVGFTTFDEALKDDVFSKSLKSYVDSAVSKGVDTYKKGNFSEAVEKGVTDKMEASKHKSPEQLQIIEMAKNMEAIQTELANERTAKTRAANKNVALNTLSESGLPSGLADFVISDTEENTLQNLTNMTKVISDHMQGLKTEQLKSNNIVVPSETNNSSGSVKEPADGASKAEWTAYFKSQK